MHYFGEHRAALQATIGPACAHLGGDRWRRLRRAAQVLAAALPR
ncbi:hypothetical protein [Pseudorhodoferax soli]|nr:hypothetical protein [Pseudorhodoferax soli]